MQLKAGHSEGTITERYIHAAQVLSPGAASRGEERLLGGDGLAPRSSAAAQSGISRSRISIVADDTSGSWGQEWAVELGGQVMLAAELSAVLGIIGTFAFVLSVLGVVLYALVRPFTHLHHEHRDDLWVHLP